MRLGIKLSLASVIDRSGLVTALRRFRSTRSGIVLTFHRVLPQASIDTCYERQIAMTDTVFEQLLILLQREFRVVPLQQLVESQGSLDGLQRVALTFDDGWEDTYSLAYPLMLRYGVPATVFICPGLMGTNRLLPEERFVRIWRSCKSREQLHLLQNDLRKWTTCNSSSLEMHFWARRLKQLPMDAKHMMLAHLEDIYRVAGDGVRRFMTWDEARIMANNGMTFGSHTMNHSTLKVEQPEHIMEDLVSSRQMIARKLGREITQLAYPNGGYDHRVIELAAEAGYSYGLTTDNGYVTRYTRPLSIPRISMADAVVTDERTSLHFSRTRVYLQRFSDKSART